MKLNQVTVRNANLLPSADEFFEKFAGYTIFSLIDLFSGYNQVKLDEKSQDFTRLIIFLGLMRMITLAQGATKSVCQFVKMILKIQDSHLHDWALPFLDNVGIKGPKTT